MRAESGLTTKSRFRSDRDSQGHFVHLPLRLSAVLTIAGFGAFAANVSATPYYWGTTGAAPTNLWATPGNWNTSPTGTGGTAAVPSGTDTAVFNGSAFNGATTVFLNDDHTIAGITFANTAATALQSSNATVRTIDLGSGGLTSNAGSGTAAIANTAKLTLAANQAWTASGGAINVAGAVAMGGNTLTLAGATQSSVTGAITNTAGAAIIKNDAGNWRLLSAGNNISANVTINAGSINFGDSGGAGGTLTGDVNLAGATSFISFGNATRTLTQTFSGVGRLYLAAGGALSTTVDNANNSFTGGMRVTASANATAISSATLSGATVVVPGNASMGLGNPTSTAAAAVEMGPGSTLNLRVNGTNDATAQTLVLFNNYTTASAGNSLAFGYSGAVSGTFNIDVGAQSGGGTNKTIAFSGKHLVLRDSTINVTSSNGSNYNLQLGTAVIGSVTSDTNSWVFNPTSANLTVGAITSTAVFSPQVILGGSSAASTVTGVISNSAANRGTRLVKSGTGTWALQGANTYAGGTTISNGILAITSDANLGAAYTGGLAGVAVTAGGSGYTGTPSVSGFTGGGGTGATGGNGTLSGGALASFTLTAAGSGYTSNPTATLSTAGGTGGAAIGLVQGLLTLDGGTLRTDAAVTSNRAVVLTSNGGTIDTNASDSTFSGVFNGVGGLTKSGDGILTLSGISTYSGSTVISGGTLSVTGTLGNTSASVGSTAVLAGNGSIAGAVDVAGGAVAPGVAGIAPLKTGALSFIDGTYAAQINTQSLQADLLDVTGDLTLGGASNALSLADIAAVPATVAHDTKLTLIKYTGTWNGGIFSGYADDSLFTFGSNTWRIDYDDSSAVTLTAVVPEPSIVATAVGAALIGLSARRRRVSA